MFSKVRKSSVHRLAVGKTEQSFKFISLKQVLLVAGWDLHNVQLEFWTIPAHGTALNQPYSEDVWCQQLSGANSSWLGCQH